MHTSKMQIAADVDLQKIAEDTELFTGAELEGLCMEAGIAALREDMCATAVCDRHFQTVKNSLKPSLTREEIDSYASFKKCQPLQPSGHLETIPKPKYKRSFLGPTLSLKVGVISFVVIVAAKYFLTYTNQTRHELAST